MKRCALALLLLSLMALPGCDRENKDHGDRRPPQVRLLHAILPLPLTSTPASTDAGSAAVALMALGQWLASGEDDPFDGIVLVGDLVTADAATLGTELKRVPKVPIYVVPGPHALAEKQTPAAALGIARTAIAEFAKAVGDNRVVDLTGCYDVEPAVTSAGVCAADIPGKKVRIVGYPSLTQSAAAGPSALHSTWTAALKSAIDGKPEGYAAVLVAPFTKPIARHFAPGDGQSAWMDVAKTTNVVLGFDANLGNRSTFEAGEMATETGLTGKWILTPPMLVTGVATPRPAQGVSAVSIAADGTPTRQVYPGTVPATSGFRPAFVAAGDDDEDDAFDRCLRAFRWLCNPGNDLTNASVASVFFIALLAAFLTAVGVWQIPTQTTSVTVTESTQPASGASGSQTSITIPQELMAKWAPASFLQQNFARTVLSGLGGLAVATLTLETVGTQSDKAAAQAFYLGWFVLAFLVILGVVSGARGLTEGFRAMSYLGGKRPVEKGTGNDWKEKRSPVARFVRPLNWFIVTASDTFFNLIQGKNELKSKIWADEITDQQEAALVAIDRVAEHLRSALVERFHKRDHELQKEITTELSDVRVAVSVLSDDGKRVYYVSWPAESSSKAFGPKSVAFVAVAGSRTRWWHRGLQDSGQDKDIVILNNEGGDLPLLEKKKLSLAELFESRSQDYTSFIVFPVPLRPAASGRKAGIHISFKEVDAVGTIWPATDRLIDGSPALDPASYYNLDSDILDSMPEDLKRLLKQSINVIESLMRSFNEKVFEQALRSRRRV